MTDVAPQQEYVQTLHGKLTQIASEIDHVVKSGHNEAQNYDYVEAAVIFNVVRKRLAERKIVILPGIEATERVTLSNEGKAPWVLTRAKLKFTIIDAETGEREDRLFQGEGADSGDKGLNKALTAGLKYFLIQLFQIPTGDDPEADTGTDAATGQAGGRSAPAPASAKTNGKRDERPISEAQGRMLYAVAMQANDGRKSVALDKIREACDLIAGVTDSRQLPRWAVDRVRGALEGTLELERQSDIPADTEGLETAPAAEEDKSPLPF